jgi:hypothetical protein
MKNPLLALLAFVQIAVLVCLVMAMVQQELVWFLASAVSVTLLLSLAGYYFLTQQNRGNS